jgi:hypothetical protein
MVLIQQKGKKIQKEEADMRTKIVLYCSLLMFFICIVQGNTEELNCNKTITVSSGEAVCDLTGKWNYEFVSRGEMRSNIGPGFLDVLEVTQQGNSFKGIRMQGAPYASKGQVAIEGELDKNGINKLFHAATPYSTGAVKAKINKDGNKIEIDTTDFFVEISRKLN